MKKLTLILMLSISSVFVGCKKETSTVDTSTTTGGTSSVSDWDSVYTFEENSYLQFSDNKKMAVFATITPFGFKTTVTTNGGLNWSSNTSKFSFDGRPQNMLFFDSKNGYGGYYKGVAKTVDGGLNWTEQKFKNYTFSLTTDKALIVFTTDSVHVIENGSLTSHYRDNQNLREFFGGDNPLFFYTDNAIYLHSRSNLNALKSEDNGKTWQALTFGISYTNEIHVLNSTTWYTLSNSSLYVTKDAGVTWSKVDNASYNTLKITNGIIFTERGDSPQSLKLMYSTDGINYKENKLASKYGYQFFTLNGRVYYTYGKNLYRRKF